ncbi:xanthine dehydrogenase small subunit [Litorivicinus lipolyticus]|nr:xanthine dehydrogenase small subunit [Litorivicinus lipolyticus]
MKTLVNQVPTELVLSDPQMTTLQWLRAQGLSGTKEGCAEGDCGACTCVIAEHRGDAVEFKPVNTCIQFASALNGKALFTVEGVADGVRLHPLQQALVDAHASQCGFCTPGFVMSLWYGAHAKPPQSRQQSMDLLAGNLCRCTGYGGLLDVADGLGVLPPADWEARLKASVSDALATLDAPAERFQPGDLKAALELRRDYPAAQIVAGNTDVGLWVTKRHQHFEQMIQLDRVAELQRVTVTDQAIELGAMVTYANALEHLGDWPSLQEMIRRIGSTQVRAVGTLGGNIANGSPIGDSPPALMALGADIRLERAGGDRWLALDDFFIEYGRQDLAADELLTRIRIPRGDRFFRSYKLSKRFDQDISAVSLGFSCALVDERIVDPIVAWGGMAGTPVRSPALEAALTGLKPAQAASVVGCLADDVTPLSDMRASAAYRLHAGQGLVQRALLALQGLQPLNLAELSVADLEGGI